MIDLYTFLDSIFKQAEENKESNKEVIDLTFEEITEENVNES